MTNGAIRLLLVEDNPADARLLRETLAELETLRCEVGHAERLSEAVMLLRAGPVDVVLLDLSLPDSTGLDTVRAIHREAGLTPVVVMTGLDDETLGVAAVREGAQDYLVKGQADPRALARSIRYALERAHIEQELVRYRDHLEELVAQRTAALETTNRILQEQMFERAQAEEALEAVRRRLMSEGERQRRHIAAELHDSVGQGLVGAKLALGNLMATEKDNLSPSAIDALTRMMDTCMLITREVRNISHGLYPPLLEALGLAPSLKELTRTFHGAAEIHIATPPEMESLRFDPDVEVAAFRIVQEAVQNALRHSGAVHVCVTVGYDNANLQLTVVDDGAGFDVHKAIGKGLGLLSMRERALAVRGDLHITSRPGETRVQARIPASPRKPEGKDQGS